MFNAFCIKGDFMKMKSALVFLGMSLVFVAGCHKEEAVHKAPAKKVEVKKAAPVKAVAKGHKQEPAKMPVQKVAPKAPVKKAQATTQHKPKAGHHAKAK